MSWYTGTVPMGTGLASMMARRMPSMLPPVDRSMTVSAPRWTAVCNFSSSSSAVPVTAELPMLALILHAAATPMAIGSSLPFRCSTLAGITIRPRATSARIRSGSSRSRAATNCISGVTTPLRADCNCVMGKNLHRVGRRRPRVASLRRRDPVQVRRVCSQPGRSAAGTPGDLPVVRRAGGRHKQRFGRARASAPRVAVSRGADAPPA